MPLSILPKSAILAVGKMVDTPVAHEGQIVAALLDGIHVRAYLHPIANIRMAPSV